MELPITKILKIKYRSIIKYLFLKGLKAKEIYEDMVKVIGKECPSYATIKNWVRNFKNGKFDIDDDSRSGRPIFATSPEMIDKVHDMILQDRRISIKMIEQSLKISQERILHIIHKELEMRKLSAKWVPKCLNSDQKRKRVETSKKILAHFDENHDFSHRLLTVDETWLYHYDPETKQQSMEWRKSTEPRPKKFKTQRSSRKVLTTVF